TGAGALAGGTDTVGGSVSGSLSAGNAVEYNYNVWQEKLLSGDYYECISSGGSENFCSQYRPFNTFPDIIHLQIGKNINYNKSIIKIISNQKAKDFLAQNANAGLAVNTINGDIFLVSGGEINTLNKKTSNSKTPSISLLWLSPMPEDFLDKNNSQDKPLIGSLKQRKQFGNAVSNYFKGYSTSGSVCIKSVCPKISQTAFTSEKRYFLGIGSGGGKVSANASFDYAVHIGNLRDFNISIKDVTNK
ncbi:hypothetical protein L1281_002587, partial [Neisseria sp. HSC-16F19]